VSEQVPVPATNPRAEGAGAPTPKASGKKTRRTQDEVKALYIAKAAAIDAKREVKHKLELLSLAEKLKAIADARPQDKALAGCVTTLIGCANAIKAEIPQ